MHQKTYGGQDTPGPTGRDHTECLAMLFLRHRYKGVKYCNERVCLFVSLSACVSQRSHIQTSANFLHVLNMAVARSSSYDNTICYIRLVLWMSSFFSIKGHMVPGVRSIDVGSVLQLAVINFQRIRQGAPRPLTQSIVVYNGSKRRTGGEVCSLRVCLVEALKPLRQT